MREVRQVDEEEVYRFLFNQIDTVPHLEALLLLWKSRPDAWAPEQLSERLFVSPEATRQILQDLARRRLILAGEDPGRKYRYESDGVDRDALMQAVAEMHKKNLVGISHFIHSKPASAVREFARAFRFTKERD